jgi:hypothetical protein
MRRGAPGVKCKSVTPAGPVGNREVVANWASFQRACSRLSTATTPNKPITGLLRSSHPFPSVGR